MEEIMIAKETDHRDFIIDISEYFDKKANKITSLKDFNKSIQDDDYSIGAQWVCRSEFKTIYNFTRKYIQTYKTYACEMMISFDPILDYLSEDDWDVVLNEFGKIMQASLRKSDVMMLDGDNIYLLLPELSEQNKITVVNRLRNNLLSAGLYEVANIHIDSQIMGPEGEFMTWNKIAV